MRILLLLLSLLQYFLIPGIAQEITSQNANLFPEFRDGSVLMKNKSVVYAPLNYDCVNQKMNFMQNGQRMILEGLQLIDTIFIDKRKFITHQEKIREVIPVNTNSSLYIEWKTKVVNKGKKGAMGMVTHSGTVQKLDLHTLQNDKPDYTDIYIYDLIPENTYYIYENGKQRKFNNLKTLCKIYAKKQEQIKSYASENNLNIQNPNDVITLLEFIHKTE